MKNIIASLKQFFCTLQSNDCTAGFWEPRFQELADYNAGIGKGIQYTQRYRRRMAALQAEYNAKLIGLSSAGVVRS